MAFGNQGLLITQGNLAAEFSSFKQALYRECKCAYLHCSGSVKENESLSVQNLQRYYLSQEYRVC